MDISTGLHFELYVSCDLTFTENYISICLLKTKNSLEFFEKKWAVL